MELTSYQNDPVHSQGRQTLVTALNAYRQFMADRYCMDFALLEETFLNRLQMARLQRFTSNVRAVLVDEYQDKNPLQEQIYFTLVEQTNASFTIVGDDDQSLYRFRGATVELFRDFEQRFIQAFPHQAQPHREYLFDNYRSTPEIVGFFNDYIENDSNFQPARVQHKPRVGDRLLSNGVPVLGMFRSDVQVLANDLTDFLIDIFRGSGYIITTGGQQVTITRASNGGDFGDAVLLSHTVNEFARAYGTNPPRQRLPKLLRDRLRSHHVEVYNPRGQLLRDIPVIQQLLGLVLECIDPQGHQQGNLRIRSEAQRYLNHWRQEARTFVGTNPSPNQPHQLSDFVTAWQNRSSQTGANWPSEWPILELCFKLITWLPVLQDDPEGQVWLEAITRCVAQAATFSPYRSTILYGGAYDLHSVRGAIQDILVPVAESAIDVDEDIMPHVPRSRFPIMTIHQAKGLEFPLVIVDVTSDYRTNAQANRFRRYPEAASSVQSMEDDLANHCAIGPLRQLRSGLERSFDDLIRLYYVAYSRPESVLLLVGNDACLRYSTMIKHVGTSWRMDGSWPWILQISGRPPALANNIPLQLI